MTQLAASTMFGIVLGAVMGLVFGYLQGIAVTTPMFWWAEAIGAMMFSGALGAQGRRGAQFLVFLGAVAFIGLDYYREPKLLDLFRQSDPAVYDHVLVGMGLGALVGFVTPISFGRR